jgi:hypothetical protein
VLNSRNHHARATAYASAVLLFIGFTAPAAAQYPQNGPYAVSINGNMVALTPGPIERGGRVFVPLRGVLERLGASVVYEGGQINATSAGHTISMRVGSDQALVDGTPRTLESPAFVSAGVTYVPLRFVSQTLGATVNYESSNRLVSIVTSGGPPSAGPALPALPPGTSIVGTLSTDLNTATAQVGDQFAINLTPPYPNDDPAFANAYIRGHVASVVRAGQGRNAGFGLAFDRLVLADGRSEPLYAHVVNVEQKPTNNKILQQAAGALGGMLVGNAIGKVIFKTNVGGAAGAAGGFLYANNLRTNFVVPKSSTVTIATDVPRRQATQPQ